MVSGQISVQAEWDGSLVALHKCSVIVDGQNSTTYGLHLNDRGVLVRRRNDRVVTIWVPNGNQQNLRVDVECEMRRIYRSGEAVDTPMLRLKITRTLNSLFGVSHGLIGLLLQ